MNRRPHPFSLAILAALSACAADPAARRAADAGTAVQQAAEAPLADLNLLQKKIPSVLQGAVQAPYALPPQKTCADLAGEVTALDAALGPDLDTPATPSDPGLVARGTHAIGDAANDALKGAAESVIPFRGWVRRLDGAERHSKEVAAAIAAGSVRRAYLKGVGQALGCSAPAAPASALAAPSVATATSATSTATDARADAAR
jgi:hypothetical protein